MSLLFCGRSRFLAQALALGVSVSTVAGALPAFADYGGPHEMPHLVTTQGHGEVKLRPDSLSLSVSIETKKQSQAEARNESNRKMQGIIAALKGLNIPNLKLETQGVSVYPLQGEYQKDKLPKIIGYQANNGLNVTVTDATPDALGDYGARILDAALNAGASNAGGLNFFVTEKAAARGKALELAVKDARNNAEAMARAADVRLTNVFSMEGTPQFGGYPRPVPMYSMKAARGADAEVASTPVETGETTVTSDVTVKFQFEGPPGPQPMRPLPPTQE